MEELTKQELNKMVREIETAYRIEYDLWNKRLRSIQPAKVREIMLKNKIGYQCQKCLTKSRSGHYCSQDHSFYYKQLTNCFYGQSPPFMYETFDHHGINTEDYNHEKNTTHCPSCGKKSHYLEMSIDHILPIANGGLEFDRENLQYMCLSCNCKKSGGKRYRPR